MGETTPNELAIPGTTVSPAWKAKAELLEALNHAVGAILLLKQLEYCPNSALHFLVWIENNLVAVVHKPNWYREAQLTLPRLVEFCSVEARANNVEFCLCELPFYAKYKTIADSDEAGHLFQSEAGQRSDLKPDAVPRRSRTLTASPYGSRPVFSGPRDPVKCRGDFE